ncbi:Spc98 family-domain-containing protein, partial [Auriculariales sp. MPI-PUGE-AT-0066]
ADTPHHDTLAEAAVARASGYNAPQSLTWDELMSEPFEGEHWQEPDDSSVSSEDYSDGLSDATSDTLDLVPEFFPAINSKASPESRDLLRDREVVESIVARQYWRNSPAPLPPRSAFHIDRPASLGTFIKLSDGIILIIGEADVVRECLITLQGLSAQPNSLRVRHISGFAQSSALHKIARFSNRLELLRRLTSEIVSFAIHSRQSRTLEAFSTAIQAHLHEFATLCSEIECSILRLFAALHDIACSLSSLTSDTILEPSVVVPGLSKVSPALVARHILDGTLLQHQAMLIVGEVAVARCLASVLHASAEPLWSMCSTWLRDGLSVQSFQWGEEEVYGTSGEFFIERHPDLAPGSSDFWNKGYFLRGQDEDGSRREDSGVPLLFQPLSQLTLAGGKAVGILRILASEAFTPPAAATIRSWSSIQDIVCQYSLSALDINGTSRLLQDYLAPSLDVVQANLKTALKDHCRFAAHLAAVQGVCYAAMGDIIADFCDAVFTVMDEQGPRWSPDTHFLQSSFRDAVAGSPNQASLDADLFRLSRTSSRARSSHSVDVLGTLSVEFLASFPLGYFFSGKNMQQYSSIFCFLVQIRRANQSLEQVFQLPDSGGSFLHLLRHRLLWIVRTLESYASSNLQIMTAALEAQLDQAVTFDEILTCHEEHLQATCRYLFIDSFCRSARAQITTILDLCLQFRTLAWQRAKSQPGKPSVRRRPGMHKRRSTRARRAQLLVEETDSEEDRDPHGDLIEVVVADPKSTTDVHEVQHDQERKLLEHVVLAVAELRAALDEMVEDFSDSTSPFALLSFHLHSGWDM